MATVAQRARALHRRYVERHLAAVVDAIDDRLGARGHTRPTIHDRLDDLERWSRQTLDALGELSVAERGAEIGRLEDLRPEIAALLNWAAGPDGYAAQAGLWLNPPVPVEHRAGGVDVLLVNERIVEQPFAFRALAGAPRVLDLGGGESSVALSLASLGHEVHISDPRGSRLAHPALTVSSCAVDDLGPDVTGFDAALALSSVEHFGLGAYGVDVADGERADARALRIAFDRVRPGGRLVLTVPFGETASADDFQRVYDHDGLTALLGPWTEASRELAWRHDRLTWVTGADPPHHGAAGVALVIAERVTREPRSSPIEVHIRSISEH